MSLMPAGGLLLVSALLVAAASCRAPEATPTTLRALYGMRAPDRLVPSQTALLLVDFQEEFFHGRLPVHAGAAAIAHARSLLEWARAGGVHIVHVHNISTRPGTPIFAPLSPTVAPVHDLAPHEGELVVVKSMAGAFSRTDLDAVLRRRGVDTLVVAGIMTHLAVDVTARDASLLGYRVLVAEDACTTRELPSATGGGTIDPELVHRVTLAALADRFADVRTTEAILAMPLR